MSLVDISSNSDNCIEHVVDTIDLSQPVFDECGQVLPVLDELVIITQPRSTCVLLEQCCIILHYLGALP